MADGSSIEWTDATWNPTRGCSRVSSGCEHCYAEGVARRFSGPGQPYEGLVRIDRDGKAKAQWNGVVRLVDDHLFDPLRWTKPRKVFVNSMSDLFHESLPFADVAAMFGVMAACPQHTFQVLTKRPERARDFFAWVEAQDKTSGVEEHGLTRGLTECVSQALAAETRIHPEGDGGPLHTKHCADPSGPWPLTNVWLGVSVEDQKTADERIPVLLGLPAGVKFVSYEPAIGPVDFDLPRCDACGHAADSTTDDGMPWCSEHENECSYGHWLDFPSDGSFDVPAGEGANGGIVWVIVGGESGPSARPFDLAWARSVVAQCADAGAACFVKQLGAAPIETRAPSGAPDDSGDRWTVELCDRKGGDMTQWPEDLRVRQFPEVRRG